MLPEIQAGIDVEIPILVKQTNKKGNVIPASNFASAELSLYTLERNHVLTKTLGSGIIIENVEGNSLFIVSLTREDTLQLSGVYLVDLAVADNDQNDSMPINDTITIKPRLGV